MAIAIIAKKNEKVFSLSKFKITNKDIIFKIDSKENLTVKIYIDEKKYLKHVDSETINKKEIDKQIEIINNNIHEYSVQGKWFSKFTYLFMEFVRNNSNKIFKSMSFIAKKKSILEINSFFNTIAPFFTLSPPDSIKQFININYIEYIKRNT